MPSANIRHMLFIDAPRRKVFEAVSTVEGFKKWWTVKTMGEEKIGGILTFGFTPGVNAKFKVSRKKIHELIELVYHGRKEDDWFNTKIIIRLTTENAKTKVDFNHNGYSNADEFYGQCNFSWAKYLQSLKSFCETGEGKPFVK